MHTFDARTRDIHDGLCSVSMFGVRKRVTTETPEGPAAVCPLACAPPSDIPCSLYFILL